MMAKIAEELHSVISEAAAEAPPLVIHVDNSETSLSSCEMHRVFQMYLRQLCTSIASSALQL